jgi:hypothetical protein
MFLAPLTARSKIREVLRGLVATRQVHTISFGHAPHFYVAGTLPEFAVPTTAYASSSMPASAYFMHSHEHDEEPHERAVPPSIYSNPQVAIQAPVAPIMTPETHTPRIPAAQPAPAGNSMAARPHFSRPAAHSRDRKPAQSSSSSRTARRSGSETRGSSSRPASARSSNGARPSNGTRWPSKVAKNTNGKRPGTHAVSGSTNGARSNGVRSNGNGAVRNHTSKPSAGVGSAKPSASAIAPRNGNGNGHGNGVKPAGKPGTAPRNSSLLRNGSAARKDARPDARSARSSRKPALAAGAKAGNQKRYGFTAPARKSAGRSTKKRG